MANGLLAARRRADADDAVRGAAWSLANCRRQSTENCGGRQPNAAVSDQTRLARLPWLLLRPKPP